MRLLEFFIAITEQWVVTANAHSTTMKPFGYPLEIRN